MLKPNGLVYFCWVKNIGAKLVLNCEICWRNAEFYFLKGCLPGQIQCFSHERQWVVKTGHHWVFLLKNVSVLFGDLVRTQQTEFFWLVVSIKLSKRIFWIRIVLNLHFFYSLMLNDFINTCFSITIYYTNVSISVVNYNRSNLSLAFQFMFKKPLFLPFIYDAIWFIGTNK